MTDLKRLVALLPLSVVFVAPGISAAQLYAPIPEQTSEVSNPTHTAQKQESTVIKNALFVRLEARPGKEKELAQFLHTGLDLARQEGTTPVWFALQLGPSTFGIFDAFSDEAGRQAHLNGPIAQALGSNAPNLLAQAPSIERIDVLGTKLPQ
jgi:quinol monooxygenase YgiN